MRRLYSNDTATSDLETLPTTQAYNIGLVTRTANSIQIRWTQGSEQNAIVLIKKGTSSGATPITVEPSDGTDYTANSVYGSGDKIGDTYVVYKGNGTSVYVTGLDRKTYYNFRVFEYRGTGSTCRYLKVTATDNPRTLFTLP